MAEEFKNLDSMELPELLKHILKNAESIQQEVREFNQSKENILEKFENVGLGLEKKSQEIENLSAEINKEISKTFQQEQGEIKKLFDYRLQEFNKVSFSLSDKDRKQLQKADETLRKWWKFPAIISGFALIFAILTGFLAFKFYKESVKSKEEIKADIAKEMQSKNLIWVEKGEWDKLKDNRELVRVWSEKNPKDSKSLESFIKGYETFKKEGK